MSKRTIIFLVIIFLLAILAFFAYGLFFNEPESAAYTSDGTQEKINITYENFESEAYKLEIVNDLPSDSRILLKFYNFDNGEKTIEKAYKIYDGQITEGESEDYEILIYLHSKYLKVMNENGFCSAINQANTRGDLGIEYSRSKAAIGIKYARLLKYGDCF